MVVLYMKDFVTAYMDGELSEDGKWQWNGSNWIPTAPNSAIQLQDSVIAGDVTIHQADAHEIAKVVHESGKCPTCGAGNTTPYSCESTNCESVFCFSCMQQYIHGHVILEYKLCRTHYESEINCLPLDYKFVEWESAVKLKLSSLKSFESLLKKATTIRPLGAIAGIVIAIAGAVGGDPMMCGVGVILAIVAMLLVNIVTAIIKSTNEKLAILKQNMPQTNPSERPRFAGRNMPNFTENSVKQHIYRQ